MDHPDITPEIQKNAVDLIFLLKLITSPKSKEEIQIEAMKYLTENTRIFTEYLHEISEKEDINLHPNINVHSTFEMPNPNRGSSQIPVVVDNETKSASWIPMATGSSNQMSDKMYVETRHAYRKYGKCPVRKRKSKYEEYGSEFSHIYRMPKFSKERETDNKAMYKSKRYDNIQKDKNLSPCRNHITIENTDIFVRPAPECLNFTENNQIDNITIDPGNNAKGATCTYVQNRCDSENFVSGLMNTLIHSKKRQEQDRVLELLRHDKELQQLFWRRASSVKKIKIPVFRSQTVTQEQDEGTCLQQSSNSEMISSYHCTSQDTPARNTSVCETTFMKSNEENSILCDAPSAVPESLNPFSVNAYNVAVPTIYTEAMNHYGELSNISSTQVASEPIINMNFGNEIDINDMPTNTSLSSSTQHGYGIIAGMNQEPHVENQYLDLDNGHFVNTF